MSRARQQRAGMLGVVGIVLLALPVSACQERANGKELYVVHCASCHGDDGSGDPRQLGLYPSLDLTRSELVRQRRSGLIYRRIAEGYGAMPGFRNQLELDEMLALRDFTLNLDLRRSEP